MWIFKGSRKLKVEKSKGKAGLEFATSTDAGGHAAFRKLPRSSRVGLISLFTSLLSTFCFLPSLHPTPRANYLYQVQEIKPQVFVWLPEDVIDQETDPLFGRTGGSGFVVTTEGVMVVDTTNSPFHARELLYEIRQRTEQPIRYVINTGSSGDEMLGNEVFVDQQAALVSTSSAQAQMRQYRRELASRLASEKGWKLENRLRGFHVTPSTQTFAGDMTIRLGGQEFRLHSALETGDAIVFLPATKVMFLGDLFQNEYFPHVGGRDVRRWIEALRQLESWDAEIYVPGHGAPGGKKELANFRGFLEWLLAQVEGRVKEGKSLTDVKKELQPSETFNWHAPDQAPEAIEAVYRQLAAAQATAKSSASAGSP